MIEMKDENVGVKRQELAKLSDYVCLESCTTQLQELSVTLVP